jgi:DNA-3-methyladenine glycosylase
VLDSGEQLVGTIVETEAYLGTRDKAAHSFGGRRTPRNESMYARAGTAYVYFTYGMHHCANVVCGKPDEPVAVLLRALEPTRGIQHMHAARTRRRDLSDRDLCSGPAKLCQALQIDRALDGADLVTGPTLFLARPATDSIPDGRVMTTARIGIPYAKEWAPRRLRWFVRDNPNVSTGRNVAC